jgi:hypothetical protein
MAPTGAVAARSNTVFSGAPDPNDPSVAVPEPYPPGSADGAATGRPP